MMTTEERLVDLANKFAALEQTVQELETRLEQKTEELEQSLERETQNLDYRIDELDRKIGNVEDDVHRIER